MDRFGSILMLLGSIQGSKNAKWISLVGSSLIGWFNQTELNWINHLLYKMKRTEFEPFDM